MRSIFKTHLQQFTHRSEKKFFPSKKFPPPSDLLYKKLFTFNTNILRVSDKICQLVKYCIFQKKVCSLSLCPMILDFLRCEATENYAVFCIGKFQPRDICYRGPIIFKNFCFFLNSTQSWRPVGFGTIFSYCLLLFLHVKIFLPIMENSQVAQKINTSIKHVVPKNQIFSDMFSIF
jgi:hypothetical protein